MKDPWLSELLEGFWFECDQLCRLICPLAVEPHKVSALGSIPLDHAPGPPVQFMRFALVVGGSGGGGGRESTWVWARADEGK